MNPARRALLPSALWMRMLIAWLLAMQPMIAGFETALAANSPLAMELCRGGSLPGEDGKGGTADHGQCCLAACTHSAAVPPHAQPVVAAPETVHTLLRPLRPVHLALTRAELSPQAARAPPL